MIHCILRSVWFFFVGIPGFLAKNATVAIFNHIIALKFAKAHRSYHHHLWGIIRMCLITASRMPVMWCTPFFASPAFPLDAIGWGKWNSSTAKHPSVTSRFLGLRVGSTAGKAGWDPEVNSRTCLGEVSLGLVWKLRLGTLHSKYNCQCIQWFHLYTDQTGRWSHVIKWIQWVETTTYLNVVPQDEAPLSFRWGFTRYSLLIAALCHDMGHFGKWKPQIGTVGSCALIGESFKSTNH